MLLKHTIFTENESKLLFNLIFVVPNLKILLIIATQFYQAFKLFNIYGTLCIYGRRLPVLKNTSSLCEATQKRFNYFEALISR